MVRDRGLICGIVALFVIFAISGCGTARKKPNIAEEVSTIKTKVETIESKLDSVEARQADAARAASEQTQAIDELKSIAEKRIAATNISIKPRTGRTSDRIRDIQVCLQNAGFYKGSIDGIKGNATIKAIKGFQKMNGLRADGIAGRKTWSLLSKYISAESAQSGGADEGTAK
ncbi:MAG: peptidoglycan-binding domain-containing protein [Candidatus Omnitrophota bacterium]|nr:peptidoglycan-binding domain-containing protein [Candidatus Omnitrophota bacterium]